MDADVIVIGAGLSGLACAVHLHEAGLTPLVLEAGERIGGRVATERRDGFLLDRGFQVLQTWYPEARRMFDYQRLDLRPFYPGALSWFDGRLHRVSDVWRRPLRLPQMITSPVGTVADKWRLLRFRHQALAGDLTTLYTRPETSAASRLEALGFSPRIRERFFLPFFSGVFFDPKLEISSHAFEFVFRAFALGDTALPAQGMEQLPRQLATRLPSGVIRLGSRVERLERGRVQLASGQWLRARAVVIATDGNTAATLLGEPQQPMRATTSIHFAAPHPPFSGNELVINGSGRGVINSLLCPSNLSEYYAPPERALVTVNCLGASHNPDTLETQLRRELVTWFGESVAEWERLAVHRIPQALPLQRPPVMAQTKAPQRGERLWLCGEAAGPTSIHWALVGGRLAAEAVVGSVRPRAVRQHV
ncbi:NAD(P)/FAD-dependent oxidoreductase [Marichromatium bheemlicum]|uniref:FAD-dependent oxidoreductase n=1 Tax=Marichromatium bheemlicum TaxID=365339 RepID=A0ABX1I6U2_9GAMM|nr:NAD(P)/FAD-dependent oxidoreductase [Marichromatium bheemlicum]NKN32125.1 FAD-dependent oxidoreductase [Marichromatium bheemlicum]